MTEYPWYSIVEANEPLAQGDILNNVPIIFPKYNQSNLVLQSETIIYSQMIMMTQTCDIQEKSIDTLFLCPIFPLEDYLSLILDKMGDKKPKNIPKWKATESNKLRKGENFGYFLLNRYSETCLQFCLDKPYYIVELKNVNASPLDFIESFSKQHRKRLRLLPPYREHLSQAFSKLFMRIGLPVDIPPFK